MKIRLSQLRQIIKEEVATAQLRSVISSQVRTLLKEGEDEDLMYMWAGRSEFITDQPDGKEKLAKINPVLKER